MKIRDLKRKKYKQIAHHIWYFKCEQLVVDLEKFGVKWDGLIEEMQKSAEDYRMRQGELYLSRLQQNVRRAISDLNNL